MKNNSDFPAFRIYEGIKEFKNIYLEFFSEDAFEQRKQYIVEFYQKGAASVEERETYISTEALDSFVECTVEKIIKGYKELEDDLIPSLFQKRGILR